MSMPDARRRRALEHFFSAQVLADIVRTSLGPCARSKLIVKPGGALVFSRDGRQVLQELAVEHPIGRLLVELSATQDSTAGDGTTSTVVLAGALCSAAGRLFARDVHALHVERGFRSAARVGLAVLEASATRVLLTPDHSQQTSVDRALPTLTQVASTCMGSRPGGEQLAHLCVQAVQLLWQFGGHDAPLLRIKLEPIGGGTLGDSVLVRGAIITRGALHESMPTCVRDARVAVLSGALETPRLRTQHRVTVRHAADVEALEQAVREQARDSVRRIEQSGATVVVCQWGIEPEIAHALADAGVLALSWVPGNEIERVALATGARMCYSLDELQPEHLGRAGEVRQAVFAMGGETRTLFEACPSPGALAILVRGETPAALEDGVQAANDCLHVVRQLLLDPRIVGGGGASQARAAAAAFLLAEEQDGSERDAMIAWAECMLTIAQTLAENAGAAPTHTADAVLAAHVAWLRPRPHLLQCGRAAWRGETPSDRGAGAGGDDDAAAGGGVGGGVGGGGGWIGISVKGEPVDTGQCGVWEPLGVVASAIAAATDCACMIVRIDRVLSLPAHTVQP